jgi:hypothetical protein
MGQSQARPAGILAVAVLRLAPVFIIGLILLTGCGGSKRHAAPVPKPGAATKLRMEARLRARGYTVENARKPAHAPYLQAFSVNNVDWTSPHAFSVSIFIFDSKTDAAQHRTRTAALVGNFPQTNKSRLVGPHLFVATSDNGIQTCQIVNGKLRCPSVPVVAADDFEKVIAIAEGR